MASDTVPPEASSPAQVQVQVAIVDDDAVLREAVIATVEAVEGLTVMGAVGSMTEALELARKGPQVFLIDLGLPDGSGFELITQLRTLAPSCKALVLTMFADAQTVVRAIEVGAHGYLLKGADLQATAGAIQVVLEGGAPLSPAVASHILGRLRAPASPRRPRIELTPRETTILESLGKGLTFKEVAEVHGISRHTVGDHVKAIYRKLEVSSRGEAIFEAAQSGLIKLHE